MVSLEKYPSLNGLRAVSILLVLIHHVNLREHMFDGITTHWWIKPLTDFLRDGQLGVNVFFVISGFLITTLMLKEEKSSIGFSIRNFYIRRVLRIFPAYYFLLLVYFILQLSEKIQLTSASWVTALTYTKYLNPWLDWITAHTWSLSIEENFYLLWPLIFLGGRRFRRGIAWAVICIVPLIRIWAHVHPHELLHEFSLFIRIDSIATGCLIAFYKEDLLNRKALISSHMFYAVVVGIIFIRYVSYAADYIHLGYLIVPFGTIHGTPGNILIGLILMYSVFGKPGGWFDFLNSRVMNFIGTLSYSIYLWQQVFFTPVDDWFLQFPQNLIFIFAAAMVSYYVIERPFLKLRSKFK